MEFKQNHQDSNCCGSGSGVRAAFPELAERSTLKKLEEMKEVGAKILLTACPFCEYQFLTVSNKYNFEIEVLDFNSLLRKLVKNGE
jgi:heterodisulfide reductase subunit B